MRLSLVRCLGLGSSGRRLLRVQCNAGCDSGYG